MMESLINDELEKICKEAVVPWYNLAFALKVSGKPRKTSFRTAGFPADIVEPHISRMQVYCVTARRNSSLFNLSK